MAALDYEAAKARLGVSDDSMKMLLNHFAESFKDASKKLQQSISENDAQSAADQAHSLKGVAGSLELLEIQNLAIEIEDKLKNDNITGAAESCIILDEKIQQAILEIGQIVSGSDS